MLQPGTEYAVVRQGEKHWMDIEHHAVSIAAPLMGIVDIAVQQHAFSIVEVTKHGLHGVESSPSISTHVNTAGNGWKNC